MLLAEHLPQGLTAVAVFGLSSVVPVVPVVETTAGTPPTIRQHTPTPARGVRLPLVLAANHDRLNRATSRLIQFEQEAGKIDEDDLEWPSQSAIETANQWLKVLTETPPDSVVPDGEGGIVLERHEGQLTERLEITAEGTTEYLRFLNAQLVARNVL